MRFVKCGLFGIISACLIATCVHSKTDPPDVSALSVLYTSLNSPSKLDGWQMNGGDPCGDGWDGIDCSGSSVTKIDLSSLKLSGSLGYQMSNLAHVTYLDVSNNNLKGDIPYQLPPNVKYLDLSGNDFTGVVPYSISQMTDLEYLNLAHNKLNGQLNDVFARLSKLTEMDLSYNSLSGDLPQSFGLLSSLTTLSLQNNKLTGSINILANISLNELNVKNNKFTGWIPNELKGIDKLETGGNSWSSGPAPPPPPGVRSHAKSQKESDGGHSKMIWVIMGVTIFGVLVIIAIILIISVRRSSSPSIIYLDDEERVSAQRQFTSLSSQELSPDSRADIVKDFKDVKKTDSSNSLDVNPLQSSLSGHSKPSLSHRIQSFSDNEFEARLNIQRSASIQPSCYSFADLQTATGNFATGRLLGKGTIGSVYRAKYPDGKVFAVKKIDSSLFHNSNVQDFNDIIVANISKCSHPSIARLVGYCSEAGHHLLVYEYFRNGSLYDFLHQSDGFSNPLTWNTRVRIALGAARAIEYLHEVCSPSTVHKNIKSANILLDAELNPRLTDCGLAKFYERTSQNLGAAPEYCAKQPSAFTSKNDVYSFGVVMLELLTGRMPFDSSKGRSEECLVRWATPQLHDIDALSKMVDPALRGLYPPKSISGFADIVALCVRPEAEFRPAMSEVVHLLTRLVQGGSRRMDDSDYY
ncbi:unnamed protein product [Rhodiola kirilowii]